MKICFPVQNDEGIESKVYNHFGSAPLFIVADTETSETDIIQNRDQHHAHGACNPIKAIEGRKIDAVIVGGIGAGALGKLNQSGIKVYCAQVPTIKGNLLLFSANTLQEFKIQSCCGGHSQGGRCSH